MQSDSKSNEKSDMNVDLCSDKTVLYNGSSESIRNKFEEITNYDKNIYKLLLKHISNLENDNKKLKENNNTVLCYQNDLENYLKKAQNDVDNLKENFRMMQSENNKLLNSLKRLNISKNSEFELCRKRRKLSVNNRPIGKNSLESEGLYFESIIILIVVFYKLDHHIKVILFICFVKKITVLWLYDN